MTGLGHILGLRLGILEVKENVWIKEIGGIDNVTLPMSSRCVNKIMSLTEGKDKEQISYILKGTKELT